MKTMDPCSSGEKMHIYKIFMHGFREFKYTRKYNHTLQVKVFCSRATLIPKRENKDISFIYFLYFLMIYNYSLNFLELEGILYSLKSPRPLLFRNNNIKVLGKLGVSDKQGILYQFHISIIKKLNFLFISYPSCSRCSLKLSIFLLHS